MKTHLKTPAQWSRFWWWCKLLADMLADKKAHRRAWVMAYQLARRELV